MPVSAWIMLAFGCIVLYGGLILCLWIARRHRKGVDDAGFRDES